MSSITVNSTNLAIEPAITPVLVAHGNLVEMPVVIILRYAVIGVVNPAVKITHTIVVLTLRTETPIPIIGITNDELTVRSGVAHNPEQRKFCSMVIETLGIVSLPKNIFFAVTPSVIEIHYSKSIQSVGNETRIGLHPVEVPCVP